MFESINILDMMKPELLVMIPVCWGFGMLFKSMKIVKNRHIPVLLVTISLILTALYILGTGYTGNLALTIFTILTQGVGYWAIAWASYEKFIKMGIKLSISNSDIKMSDDDDNDKEADKKEKNNT